LKKRSRRKFMITEVIVSLCVIWAGIAFLIFRVDRRISSLERKINE